MKIEGRIRVEKLPDLTTEGLQMYRILLRCLGLGFTKDEGILSTIPYILNGTALDQLSENWDQLGSQIVFGKCCLFSTEELSIAKQIR